MSEVELKAQRDLSIAGDVVGRDKITNIYQYGEKKEHPAPRMAPPAPRVFIGRDEVLRELIAALKLGEEGAGPIALTALKGMGGIGKTTLAAALANHSEVETALSEGTLWAGLGPEPEVMSLLAEWGAQLGEDFAQFDSPETRSRRLSTLLHDKKALLIVDDVWQAEAARYFLVGGSRCRSLITTRDNEIARNLDVHKVIGVETLTNAASLNLLRELAPKAVAADEKAANELATVLDGLPLALKLAGQMLAAKWEAGRGVATALSQLKDREARLKLAGTEKRLGLATTKHSLRAILAMSYESLPEEATKRAFRLLGVFGGKPITFSFEAAAAVWGMEFLAADDVITSLVGRALVEPVESGRYTLHTTLADFAESLLEEYGEAAPARETHANYYLEFAWKNAEKNWQAVDVEMGQIHRGFDWVSSISKNNQMVLDYEQALRTFFSRRGLYNEKIRWAQIGLEVACVQDERALEARLLNVIGYSYRRKGELNEALEYFERSMMIQEEIGDRAGLTESLVNIGIVHNIKGLRNEALEYYERSRAIFEELGDRAGLATAFNHIGGIYIDKGLWGEALECLEHSRVIREEIGNRRGLAWSLNDIGNCYRIKGLLDEALEYCERSRAIQEEIGDQASLAWTLYRIGQIYQDKGVGDKALEYYKSCQDIFEKIGEPDRLAQALFRIGEIYKNKGVWDEALEYFERGRALFDEIGNSTGLAMGLWLIGDVYEKQMRLVEAEQALRQTIAIYEMMGSSKLEDARKQLDKVRELQRIAPQK